MIARYLKKKVNNSLKGDQNIEKGYYDTTGNT